MLVCIVGIGDASNQNSDLITLTNMDMLRNIPPTKKERSSYLGVIFQVLQEESNVHRTAD